MNLKKMSIGFLLSFLGFQSQAQTATADQPIANALLWRISGNGLKEPSYLFGTIHMLCKTGEDLGDSLSAAIRNCDKVYLEVDMDNVFEMMGMLNKMKMNDDTTLADLLSAEDYATVKIYFQENKSILPFNMLETYKPMLAASTLMQASMDCPSAVAMEQLIMNQAKEYGKSIYGLETMSYQLSIFDSIPYKIQAEQLVEYIKKEAAGESDKETYDLMMHAYEDQDLGKLEEITKSSEIGMGDYTDLLLYNRNRNWVKKLETLLPGKKLLIAVGAGHLPGDQGVINLLRKKGFTVTPIDDPLFKKVTI